jgi:DHA2 family multidrug resistance protein
LETEAAEVVHPKTDRAPGSLWLPAIAIMLSATMEMLDTSVVNVSLPHIAGT